MARNMVESCLNCRAESQNWVVTLSRVSPRQGLKFPKFLTLPRVKIKNLAYADNSSGSKSIYIIAYIKYILSIC